MMRWCTRLLSGVTCLLAVTGCDDNPATSGCHDVEGLADSDSVAVLNVAHAGDELQIRIAGRYGWCSSLLRVESESRGDTVLLRPIVGTHVCPHTPCAPGLKSFADTVAVPTQHPGPLWVRVDAAHGRLVDSTTVLLSGVRAP